MIPERAHQAEMWHAAAEIFENQFDSGHLKRAIDCYRKAVDLTPQNDTTRPIYLHHLSIALMRRVDLGGSTEDLQVAIDTMREATTCAPIDDSYYATYLANFGMALFKLSRATGSTETFENGMKALRQAINMTDNDDPNRLVWLTEIREGLFSRSESTGSLSDVEVAIAALQEDSLFGPNDDPIGQYQLATLLQRRYLQNGSMPDLDLAITILEQLLTLTPADDLKYPSLVNNLGNAVRIRARRTKSKNDCNRAIELQELAVSSLKSLPNTPPEELAIYLASLASGLIRRYELTESTDDLDRAIVLYDQALESTSTDSQNLGNMLGGSANALLLRFEKTQSLEHLDAAISNFQRALALQNSQYRAQTLNNLGWALHNRFKKTDSKVDFEKAITTLEQAASSPDSPPDTRITAASAAAGLLFHHDAHRTARLLESAVNLFPTLSPRLLNRTDQQFNLSSCDGIVWAAASASLEAHGDAYRALRLTETGRGVLANLQLDISSDISSLEKAHPDIAQRFQRLRNELRLLQSDEPQVAADHYQEIRALTEQFDSVVSTIRELQGFETFLLCPSKNDLMEMARVGPIVVFSVSECRSDALLVTPESIRSIALPSLKNDDVVAYSVQFLAAVHIGRLSVKHYSESNKRLKSILEWLWDVAVGPVLQELGYTGAPDSGKDWPRVWWVRAGVFSLLPLHAAGYHDANPPVSAIDRVISSYTPTIKSLEHVRKRFAQLSQIQDQKVLVIGMPTTPDQSDLPMVESEMEELRKIIPEGKNNIFIRNPEKKEIFSILRECQIVHFSCHGLSSPVDPSLSSLLLSDWKTNPLTVSDLRSLRIELGELAYLSACHSANSLNSEMRLLDESIHLSSAFQLAGFQSVIATLWYVYDTQSATVAKQVYLSMLDESMKIQSERSAEALHHAVRRLRDDLRRVPNMSRRGPDNPLIWAAYIHLGV